MDLQSLFHKIHLQKEVQEEIAGIIGSMDLGSLRPSIEKLKKMETEASARAELTELLGADPDKIKMLACMLICAADQYQWYREKGISEAIFTATMGCFTRFIEECRQITGRYAFDREWWTARQVSGSLFRIGELEYEMISGNSGAAISIHIPSDSILTEAKCDSSLEAAKAFFAEIFPMYKDAEYSCHSWLLAPELKDLLPGDSRILAFQRRFQIHRVDYQGNDYLEWVFKTRDGKIDDFPEDTLLQRNMKQHLKNGGKIGTGLGRLAPGII